MTSYYEIDRKDYEEAWPRVKRVAVKAIFHKNMKYLFLYDAGKSCYMLPCTEAGENEENPRELLEELAEKLIGADITSAGQKTLGQGRIIGRDEHAEQKVEKLYVYTIIDLDKISCSTEGVKADPREGLEARWIDLEKANPEKNCAMPEGFDGDFEMALAEYNGLVEDIGKWLGDKMTSEMLDGPGMINPAYYIEHNIPVKEAEIGRQFMGMAGSLLFNSRQFQNENTESGIAAPGEEWICSCGAKNNGKYCTECGKKGPEVSLAMRK